ncbi:MAG: tRNA lysidine(34) synthetase TilS, partial [Halobacteriovoraceae bacterium]|nr:tRNA lysidine(34) synthetase TilS [Halobacteriovoraceae bacterium]
MHRISDLDLTKWVGDFIVKHGLSGEKGRIVVGLSGGPDSILLSHVCEALKEQGVLYSVRHVHIDHGLRWQSGEEALKLKSWAKTWRWEFSLKKITGPIPKSNIESWGRENRRALLLGDLDDDEVLFLAHHIDDSFEWYLRKTLNSSKGDFSFGIPLINGKVRRPFHCLTRGQIERFIQRFQIPYIEDESNSDIRFQRNALRKEVKKPLLKLFPKGLAHYVERSNQWAREKENETSSTSALSRFSLGKNIICLIKRGGSFRDFEKDILVGIKQLSSQGRGSLRLNLEKLYLALETNGRPGPLDFSGGVKIKMYGETLILLND